MKGIPRGGLEGGGVEDHQTQGKGTLFHDRCLSSLRKNLCRESVVHCKKGMTVTKLYLLFSNSVYLTESSLGMHMLNLVVHKNYDSRKKFFLIFQSHPTPLNSYSIKSASIHKGKSVKRRQQ